MSEIRQNPFVIVYDALWALALSNKNLEKLVKPGNRISFGSAKNDSPIKDVAGHADLPELLLTQSTATANIHNSSCGIKVVRAYTFILNTGDYRLSANLSQVEWALLCGLCNYKAELLELKWNDKNFVIRPDVVSIATGESDQQRNRGIRGWSAAWSVEVEMHFAKTDILSELICQS